MGERRPVPNLWSTDRRDVSRRLGGSGTPLEARLAATPGEGVGAVSRFLVWVCWTTCVKVDCQPVSQLQVTLLPSPSLLCEVSLGQICSTVTWRQAGMELPAGSCARSPSAPSSWASCCPCPSLCCHHVCLGPVAEGRAGAGRPGSILQLPCGLHPTRALVAQLCPAVPVGRPSSLCSGSLLPARGLTWRTTDSSGRQVSGWLSSKPVVTGAARERARSRGKLGPPGLLSCPGPAVSSHLPPSQSVRSDKTPLCAQQTRGQAAPCHLSSQGEEVTWSPLLSHANAPPSDAFASVGT